MQWCQSSTAVAASYCSNSLGAFKHLPAGQSKLTIMWTMIRPSSNSRPPVSGPQPPPPYRAPPPLYNNTPPPPTSGSAKPPTASLMWVNLTWCQTGIMLLTTKMDNKLKPIWGMVIHGTKIAKRSSTRFKNLEPLVLHVTAKIELK